MANDFSARQPRRKYCQFCKENTEFIDYKDTQLLRKYMTDRGKISVITYDLLTDKNGDMYFEYGCMLEKVNIDDFEEAE